jgi:hypothetical protein
MLGRGDFDLSSLYNVEVKLSKKGKMRAKPAVTPIFRLYLPEFN